jgi:hypothetical protein
MSCSSASTPSSNLCCRSKARQVRSLVVALLEQTQAESLHQAEINENRREVVGPWLNLDHRSSRGRIEVVSGP